eukprot:15295521-Alexandrium_andersonii.AAC.1
MRARVGPLDRSSLGPLQIRPEAGAALQTSTLRQRDRGRGVRGTHSCRLQASSPRVRRPPR